LPWLHAFSPENELWLNPASAASVGVHNGDMVQVASAAGRTRVKARITAEIRPDCVFMLHGFGKQSRWQRLAASPEGSDAKVIEAAYDPVSGNAAMHATFVEIRKA
jgi:thiosulfate reductase/polysulfide reductase chain A